MSKIVFQKVEHRLYHPDYAYSHGHEYISCDLARPAVELHALACLVSGIPWIEAMEQDGTLYFKNCYSTPYVLQERSLHQALGIARTVLSEGLKALRDSIKEVPDAMPTDSIYGGIYTQESGKYAMPERYYGPGFVTVEEAGGHFGYFVINRSYYHDKSRSLAAAILATLLPSCGIGPCQERSYSQISIARPSPELRDAGAASIAMAQAMIQQMKKRMAALPLEGKPSAFLDEDDDARDVLLTELMNGSRIIQQARKGADFHDVDGNFDYCLEDGSPLSIHVVERLMRAHYMQLDGHISHEDGQLKYFVVREGLDLDQRAIAPRADAVPFASFQSYCSYRRHPEDGEKECIQRNHHGYNSYCTSGDCPILRQAYSEEYGCRFDNVMEDPAFEEHLLDDASSNDPLMEAIHDNTRRSGAWRAAGQGRMMGVVNQVLRAHVGYGAPMLLESFHARAVDEAVAAGWLEIVETNALGVVAKAAPQLLQAYQDQQTGQEARAPAQA